MRDTAKKAAAPRWANRMRKGPVAHAIIVRAEISLVPGENPGRRVNRFPIALPTLPTLVAIAQKFVGNRRVSVVRALLPLCVVMAKI